MCLPFELREATRERELKMSRLAGAVTAGLAGLASSCAAHAQVLTQSVLQIPDSPATARALVVQLRDTTGCASSGLESGVASIQQELTGLLASRGLDAQVVSDWSVPQHLLLDLGRVVSLQEADAAADTVRTAACVAAADVDTPIYPAFTPDDPRFSQQWYLGTAAGATHASTAWDGLPNVAGTVRAAILDTGVTDHPDMVWIVADRDGGDNVDANYCYAGAPATASTWHGTKVAGIITGRLSNNLGMSGISGYNDDRPTNTVQSETHHYKVLGKCGGLLSTLVSQLNKAVADGAASRNPQVVNMSLQALGACPSTLQSAIDAAVAKGMPVVVAAGNSGKDVSEGYPANCRGVVTVAATNRAGARAWYSNYGTAVALSAPGGELKTGAANAIMTARNPSGTSPMPYDQYNQQQFVDRGYEYVEGTSFAAPMVSAALVMIMSAYGKTSAEAIDIVKSTASAFPGACTGCGTGILDVAAALAKAKPRRRNPPPPDCDAHPELCH